MKKSGGKNPTLTVEFEYATNSGNEPHILATLSKVSDLVNVSKAFLESAFVLKSIIINNLYAGVNQNYSLCYM